MKLETPSSKVHARTPVVQQVPTTNKPVPAPIGITSTTDARSAATTEEEEMDASTKANSLANAKSTVVVDTKNSAQASVPLPSGIIIVPNAMTSVISQYNVLKFLQDGEFVSVEEMRNKGVEKKSDQLVTRVNPASGQRVTYKIIDNPAKLKDHEWERVVAVFALGPLWQFKDFKWNTPVSLFSHVLGVHLTWDDRAVDANVQSWNCKVLKVKCVDVVVGGDMKFNLKQWNVLQVDIM